MPTAIRSMPPNTRATHPGDLARPSIPLMLIEFIREPASKNRSHICIQFLSTAVVNVSPSRSPTAPRLFSFPSIRLALSTNNGLSNIQLIGNGQRRKMSSTLCDGKREQWSNPPSERGTKPMGWNYNKFKVQ